jgi:hypothetical protein
MNDRVDVAVVGAGIVGLATALRLLQARPSLRVAVLEKEAELAVHQSGHNSGVIHAGIYYPPGSLKARLCREGKAELEVYLEAKAIPFERVGKLVVALREDEQPRLAALADRARANAVPGLEEVSAERLREIEPQDPVPHQAGSRYQHGQNFLVAQPGKVHMLQRILGTADGDGDTDVVRDQGQHTRGAFHELLHVGNPMQGVFNNALVFLRKAGSTRKLFYIIAIRL